MFSCWISRRRPGVIHADVPGQKNFGQALDRVPPDVGLAPSAAWRPPPSTPLRSRTPSPPTSLGRPFPEPCKKSQWGVGGRAGREGVWLEGRFLQLQSGMGGPPNPSWGQTHIWGLPTRNLGKTSMWVRTSMTQTRGRP